MPAALQAGTVVNSNAESLAKHVFLFRVRTSKRLRQFWIFITAQLWNTFIKSVTTVPVTFLLVECSLLLFI